MPMTVTDLSRQQELGLQLAAGERSAGNVIEAAHVCELRRPGSWLHAGELLMTIGKLRRSELPDLPPSARPAGGAMTRLSGRALGVRAPDWLAGPRYASWTTRTKRAALRPVLR